MKQFVKSPAFTKLCLFVFSLNLIHKIKAFGHIPVTESTAFRVGYVTSMLIIGLSIISISIHLIKLRKRAGLIKL